MQADEARQNRTLLRIAAAVADGDAVDWDAAAAAAESTEEREILDLLKTLHAIAEHHRTTGPEDQNPAAAGGA